MPDRNRSYIAPDGWWYLLPVAAGLVLAMRFDAWWLVAGLVVLLVPMVMLFRDPARNSPTRPLAMVSPVDGKVIACDRLDSGVLNRPAHRVRIRVDNLGAYAARSPVAGRVMELSRDALSPSARLLGVSGLWVRGESGADVVVVIHALWLLGKPRALLGYGERVGQGQRFAWLRLSRETDVYLPLEARVTVSAGERVRAGLSILAELPARN